MSHHFDTTQAKQDPNSTAAISIFLEEGPAPR